MRKTIEFVKKNYGFLATAVIVAAYVSFGLYILTTMDNSSVSK